MDDATLANEIAARAMCEVGDSLHRSPDPDGLGMPRCVNWQPDERPNSAVLVFEDGRSATITVTVE